MRGFHSSDAGARSKETAANGGDRRTKRRLGYLGRPTAARFLLNTNQRALKQRNGRLIHLHTFLIHLELSPDKTPGHQCSHIAISHMSVADTDKSATHATKTCSFPSRERGVGVAGVVEDASLSA